MTKTLQDWKGECRFLQGARPYDPNPPAVAEVDIQKYPLKLAQITKDSTKKGWEAYKIVLPNEVRMLHLDDPIHGGDWRNLVLDFDRKSFRIIRSSKFCYIWSLSLI